MSSLTKTGTVDRFDLEEAIMRCWQTADDLSFLTEQMFDAPTPMSEDETLNVLIGLSTLHSARCQRLFDVFEAMLESDAISNYKSATFKPPRDDTKGNRSDWFGADEEDA